ncbi:UrcA family protein [Altererythrobacter atlanticus]|uniref:Uncharacterized protein n=1 Tax=Croceibacterium atlanticum TaxID=1267766 RepID=A0A0F7KWY2_9SPHN|nr:UrcA family protein [Croceibacterium atlanticum]AKH43310.1 hypothetical protein WYH_02278 [Croceibacterium atlanticum]MBB5731984.1 UrcA family protein [Croceibacterium atlanticum]
MKTPTAILAAAAALTAATAITPAMAGQPTERVSYSDLNLTTQEGQDILQQRLNKAAWRVCMFDAKGQLQTAEHQNACYRQARKDVAVRVAEVIADHQRGG